MPGKLLEYKEFRKYSNIFIETGTSAGDGVYRALDAGFPIIHSIEAAEIWFEVCAEKFLNEKRVHLHLGLSKDVLGKDIIDEDPGNIIFFLDAHPSHETSMGYLDVMEKGDKSDFCQHKTILAELAVILPKYKRPIIIIDDMQGWDDATKCYAGIISKAGNYSFELYDQKLDDGSFYRDKYLVALPKELL